jgi:type II secretory pathway component PulF
MGYYQYRALTREGERVAGKIMAADTDEVLRNLRERGLQVFELKPISQAGTALKTGKVTPEEYFRIIQQTGVLVGAGVPILEAVESLRATVTRKRLAEEMALILADLRQGSNFSDAVERHMPGMPRYAPPLLRLAEATGQFAPIAGMVAEQMQTEEQLRKDVRSSLNYPLFLMSVGVLATGFIFYFVVPRFQGMVAGQEDKLPAASRLVFDAGLAFRDNFLLITGVIAAIVFAVSVAARLGPVRQAASRIAFRMPVIGGFKRLTEQGAWLRVMGLSSQAGGRMTDNLDLAASITTDPARRNAYDELQRSVRSGQALSAAIRLNLDFDPLAVNLIETGERAGRLPEMLMSASAIYDSKLSELSKRLTSLAEPTAVLVISAIVGGVVLSLVTAMTSIYDVAL